LQPVPAEMLDAFCERKFHQKTKERMKFFDRHLNQRQCRQVRLRRRSLWLVAAAAAALLCIFMSQRHPASPHPAGLEFDGLLQQQAAP
jgi:hypothetical protein